MPFHRDYAESNRQHTDPNEKTQETCNWTLAGQWECQMKRLQQSDPKSRLVCLHWPLPELTSLLHNSHNLTSLWTTAVTVHRYVLSSYFISTQSFSLTVCLCSTMWRRVVVWLNAWRHSKQFCWCSQTMLCFAVFVIACSTLFQHGHWNKEQFNLMRQYDDGYYSYYYACMPWLGETLLSEMSSKLIWVDASDYSEQVNDSLTFALQLPD